MLRAKSLVLKLPGARRTVNAVKRFARAVIPYIPGLRHSLWRNFFVEPMPSDECLVSALQTVAHELDHHMIRGVPVPIQSMMRMEVLLHDVRRRGIPLGPSLQWTMKMYAIAKTGVDENYLKFSTGRSEETTRLTSISDLDIQDAGPKHTEIVDCISTRRSVRQWTDRELDLGEVRKLIDVAMWAPSSCNRQAWKVLLLTDPQDKRFLTQYYRSVHNHFWVDAPLLLVVMANLEAYLHPRTRYVQLDSGAFIQNLMLLFHSCGLGACWVGFTCWDNYGNCHIEESKRDQFYEHFGIPTHYMPTTLIPVGYPAVSPPPPARKTVDEIVVCPIGLVGHDVP